MDTQSMNVNTNVGNTCYWWKIRLQDIKNALLYLHIFMIIITMAGWIKAYIETGVSSHSIGYQHDLFNAIVIASYLGPLNLLRYYRSDISYGIFIPVCLGVCIIIAAVYATKTKSLLLTISIDFVLMCIWVFAGMFHQMMMI